MPLIIRDDTNTPRTITALVIRDGTNTPRTITELRVRDTTNTSRVIYSTGAGLSVSVSDPYVFGTTLGGGVVTTDSTTATASGGVAPYTYAWTVTAFNNATSPIVDSDTSATTTFTQTGVGIAESYFGQFLVTATDSTPGTPLTATATVMASFTDIS